MCRCEHGDRIARTFAESQRVPLHRQERLSQSLSTPSSQTRSVLAEAWASEVLEVVHESMLSTDQQMDPVG